MSSLAPQAAHHEDPSGGNSSRASTGGSPSTFATLFLKDLVLLRPIATTVAAFVLLAALVVAALPLLGVSALRWFGYTQRDDLFDRLDPVASIALVGGALMPFLCAPMILQGDRGRGAGSFFATLPIGCTTRWMSKLAAAVVVGLIPFVLAGLLRAPSFAVKSDDISNGMSLAALAWLAGAAGAVMVRGVPSAAILGAAFAGAIAALAWSVSALIRLPIYRGVFAWSGFDAEFNDYLEGNPVGTFMENAASSPVDAMPMWLLIATVVAALLLVIWMGRKIVVNGSEPVRKFRGVWVGVCAIALSGSGIAGVLHANRARLFARDFAPYQDELRRGFERLDKLPTDELFRSWITRRAAYEGSPQSLLLDWVVRSGFTFIPNSMRGMRFDFSHHLLPDENELILGGFLQGEVAAINERRSAEPASFERIVRGVATGGLPATPLERMSAADTLGPYHLAAAAAEWLASAPDAVGRLRAIKALAGTVKIDDTQGSRELAFEPDGLKMARDGIPGFALHPSLSTNFVGQARARAVIALVALEYALAQAARDGDSTRLADLFGGPAPVVTAEVLAKARAELARPIPELRESVEQARARTVDPADVGAVNAASLAKSVTAEQLEAVRRGAECPISELFDLTQTDPVYLRGVEGK
jgi:hypothetical protein